MKTISRKFVLSIALVFLALVINSFTLLKGAGLTVNVSNVDLDCYGEKANLFIEVTGGTGLYTIQLYTFNPIGAINISEWISDSPQNTVTFTNLPGGDYLIQALNTDGKTGGAFPVINEPTELILDSIGVIQGPSCFDSENAILEVFHTGGTADYNYLWSGGNAAGQTNKQATGLGQGTYGVTITDDNGCTVNGNKFYFYGFDNSIPSQLTLNNVLTTPTCETSSNGTLTITGSNGTPPLDYAIVRVSDGDSTFQDGNNIFTGLSSGQYTPWVIDDNGCTISSTDRLVDSIKQPIAPTMSKTPDLATVCDGQNVSAAKTADGQFGSGCSDTYEYRTNGGAWQPYTPGTNISTSGISSVDVRASRGGCTAGLGCATDENTYSWTVVAQPEAAILDKSPNATDVCEGQNISASINAPGTGGDACSNSYEYRIDGGVWQAYTMGNAIATAGVTSVDIRSIRGTCTAGAGCTTDINTYSWTVQPQPQAAVLSKSPNLTNVCDGQPVSASKVSDGSGGVGCTDAFEYRTDGGAWQPYTLGTPIVTTGLSSVDIRTTRGGCTGGLSCTPDENTYSWTIDAQPVATTLTKSPNSAQVCENQGVSATIAVPGSGGFNCTNTYEYRTDGGAWQAYTPGDNINTTGLSSVDIRSTRGGCEAGAGCTTDAVTYSWTVVPQPQAATLTISPNLATVCDGQPVSASINQPASGGVGCSESYHYRIDGGAWQVYTLGNAIPTAGASSVDIRSTYGGCTAGLSCLSDENIYSINVAAQPLAPVMGKSPNVASVCDGQNVSATVSVPGSGGSGCSNVYEYRIDGGAWQVYTPGNNISTIGASLVELRSAREGCTAGAGCIGDENTYSWNVLPQPVASTFVKSPNVNSVCQGQAVSATVDVAGTGGVGCANTYYYRTDGGAWQAYVPGAAIATAGVTSVDIRALRDGCTAGLSCTSDENIISWTVALQPVAPTMTPSPAVGDVCEGQAISAITLANGSEGVGCTDTYEYRTDGGAWQSYTRGTPIATTGISSVDIRASRGGCTAGISCTTDENIYSWTVQPQPTAPVLLKAPAVNSVCDGQNVSATVSVPGTGGVSCTNTYEYRTDGGVWQVYVPGDAINTSGLSSVDIRSVRGGCSAGIGCSSDENIYSWTVVAQPVASTLNKIPNATDVCDGQAVSATINVPGAGGVSCTNTYEYRTNGGAWQSYTLGTSINTTGLTSVDIRATRGGCTAGVNCTSDENTYSWNIQPQPVAPVLSKIPNVNEVCDGQDIAAMLLVPGSGGIGCSSTYEYRTNGGAWQPYVLGDLISTTGLTSVDIRAQWGGCSAGLSCTTAENIYAWTVRSQPIAPTLNIVPNSTEVCEGANVRATQNVQGSGGVSCTDVFEYRLDNGAWLAYTLGTNVSSTGLDSVSFRATRGGCTAGVSCVSDENVYTVIVQPQPVAATLTIVPNTSDVCEGTDVSAVLNLGGSGGVGCSDTYQYRINGGAWQPYALGALLSTEGISVVEIKSSRGSCTSGLSCTLSENVYTWSVQPQPVAPVLTKTPNTINICKGENVSASLQSPGTGGDGCGNTYFYRTNVGVWLPYTPGNTISTATADSVDIISIRGGCNILAGCDPDTNYYSWRVNTIPNANAGAGGDACELSKILFAFPSVGNGSWNQVSGPGSVTSWDPNANANFVTVNVDLFGTYEFSWTENNNGCSDADTIEVTFHQPPEADAGSDATICYDSSYTITDADTNNATSLVWVSSGDGAFDVDDIIAPTYTPGTADRQAGSVWLYLESFGHITCASAIDSMELTIPNPVEVAIGGPQPFAIGPNTEVWVKIKTQGHKPNMDLSYYLVAPDGTTRIKLKETPYKYTDPVLIAPPCNLGSDVDLLFTTERPNDDTLIICTGVLLNKKIVDTVNITGSWSDIYGLNPAEGGWAIEVHDHIVTGAADQGNLVNASITFIDTATATGLVTPISFESGDTLIPIKSGSGWPIAGVTKFQIPRGLRVSCAGECDAEAHVTVTGGTGSYIDYLWDPLPADGNGQDSVYLCAGTYSVTVTDDLGCKGSASVEVTEPPAIVFNKVNATDTIQCNGDSSAVIIVKATGGTGKLTYSLIPGDIPSESADSGLFTQLPAGTYTVVVEDGTKCSIDSTLTIYQKTPLVLDTAYVSDSVFCVGDSVGQIISLASGGTAPYSFILEPLDSVKATGTFMHLPPGKYVIKVTDANACDTLVSDTLYTGNPVQLQIDSIVQTPIACYGESGALSVYIAGGRKPYEVSIDSGVIYTPGYDALAVIPNLGPGEYDVFVRDTKGCMTSAPTEILINPPQIIADTVYHTDTIVCHGDTTGIIVMKASGGRGPITYVLNPGNIPSESADSGLFINLPANTYTITATDSVGCTLDSTVIIAQFDSLQLDTAYVSDSVFCAGDLNGRIIAQASGAKAPYSYILEPGTIVNNSGIFAGLSPGKYVVRVTGLYSCDTLMSDTLYTGSPVQLAIDSLRVLPIVCNGDAATMNIYIAGGYKPYDISIQSGIYLPQKYDTAATIPNLGPGLYDVIVRDSKGCTFSYPSQVVITEPPVLSIDSLLIKDVTTCWENAEGTVKIYAHGGQGQLTYSVANLPFQADSTIVNMTGGNYTAYVRDTLGCIVEQDFTVDRPEQLQGNPIITNVQGIIPGSIEFIPTGGTPFASPDTNYLYSIDGGTTYSADNFFDNLPAGQYDLWVKDGNGCVWQGIGIISDVSLDVDVTVTNVSCFGEYDGRIQLAINDGTKPYSITVNSIQVATWDFAAPTQYPLVDYGAGTYVITILDSESHRFDTTVTITQPDAITLSHVSTNPTCHEYTIDGGISTNGAITVAAAGGVGEFNYIWSDNPTLLSPVRTGLSSGMYIVTVTDANACIAIDTIQLNGDVIIDALLVASDSTPCYLYPDTIRALPYGNQYSYMWFPDTLFSDNTSHQQIMRVLSTTSLVARVSTSECYDQDTIRLEMWDTIGMNIISDAFTVGDSTYTEEGGTVTLHATPGYIHYEWLPANYLSVTDDSVTASTPLQDIQYRVIGITPVGCPEHDTIYVLLRRPIDEVYSGFTPNGDGVNDYWEIPNAGQYPNLTVEIFNRWGQVVYKKSGYGTSKEMQWDGKNMKNGKDLPIGTYYYIITPNDGKTTPFSGSISLIR